MDLVDYINIIDWCFYVVVEPQIGYKELFWVHSLVIWVILRDCVIKIKSMAEHCHLGIGLCVTSF